MGVEKLTASNTLLCIFSYNMGPALDGCIQSTMEMCPGFDLAIIDDQSTDEETRQVLARHRNAFKYFFISEGDKQGRRHGNLYRNIESMCALATSKGYEYIFLIQDDMQFVRPFDVKMQSQYTALFGVHDKVLQVDPRFLRKGYPYEILRDCNAYTFPEGDRRRSYADVGIVRLSVLNSIGWTFLDSEAENKRVLSELGYQRLFPFSPIVMHVPFPVSYRNGKRKFSLLPFRRGQYKFHPLTPADQAAMDSRDIADIPYFRTFLRPKGMHLARLYYMAVTDASALR